MTTKRAIRQIMVLLQEAVKDGDIRLLRLLLGGVPRRFRNFKLRNYTISGTLLHLAASQDFAEIVQFLLLNGLDDNIRNNLGETPLEVAQDHGSTNSALVLEIARGFRVASPVPTPLRRYPFQGDSIPEPATPRASHTSIPV